MAIEESPARFNPVQVNGMKLKSLSLCSLISLGTIIAFTPGCTGDEANDAADEHGADDGADGDAHDDDAEDGDENDDDGHEGHDHD